LLLVDGVRSAAELERLMQAAGVTPGALQLLMDKGLIRFPEEKQQLDARSPTAAVTKAQEEEYPTLFLEPMSPTPPAVSASAQPASATASSPSSKQAFGPTTNPLEVVTLAEIETILGVATELEMETIIGVASKLEATPTQVKAPPSKEVHLPPPASAHRAAGGTAAAEQKKVIPAAILTMNLMVARAHLANALDQHLEIDGYLLRQKVVACESRAELEKLSRVIEAALLQKLEKAAVARTMGIAHALLER
jgi:hypothetical protein